MEDNVDTSSTSSMEMSDSSTGEINKPVLVLDLDETLIFSYQLPPKNQYTPIRIGRHRLYIGLRPGLFHFLERVSQLYEIFIFTSSKREYANRIIDLIFPNIDNNHRLFRESCTLYNGYQVKDLRILNRPMNNIILVDDLQSSGMFQRANLIHISPWMGDENDNVLTDQLLPLLESIHYVDDIHHVLQTTIDPRIYPSLSCF